MKTIPTTKQAIEFLKDKLDKMPLDGKYYVEIKAIKTKRSIDQNALYWAWLTFIAVDIEFKRSAKDYYHSFFKAQFLPAVVKDIFGKKTRCYKSTSELTTEEFAEYLDRIEFFMSERDCVLPKVLGKKYDQMMEVYG